MDFEKETGDEGLDDEAEEMAHRLCLDMLLAGRPRAFRELFKILNLSGVEHRHHGNSAQKSFPSEAEIEFVQSQLLHLENAVFQENLSDVCDTLRAITEYYLQNEDGENARYFGMQLVEQSWNLFEERSTYKEEGDNCEGNDKGSNGAVRLGHAYSLLGKAESLKGDIKLAIISYTRQLEVAKQNNLEEEESEAIRNLIITHNQYVESLDKSGDETSALNHLQQCLEYSQRIDDKEAVASCKYKIGKQFYNLERYADATKLLKEYLKYCQSERDVIGESAACYALAQSCFAMDDMENCVASLEAFLELSHNSDYLTQMHACCTLGKIMFSKGEVEKARECFEKFFSIASDIKEKKLRSLARINIGLARAKIDLPQFYKAVREDIDALLEWKNTRKAFDFDKNKPEGHVLKDEGKVAQKSE